VHAALCDKVVWVLSSSLSSLKGNPGDAHAQGKPLD
jgi:hypothetical protein